MSAMMVAGAVGTGFSIYSGISGGNAAKNAQRQAENDLAQNQQLAQQLKAQEAPTEAVEQQQIGELSSKNLTPQDQMAQDQFKNSMQQQQQQIQANSGLTGEGVAGSRALSNQFQQAQGIAGIGLQDAVNKRSQLGSWVDKASQEPAWARVASGANKDMANQQAQWSNQDATASGSAYGAAAKGLMGLAQMYNAPDPAGDPVTNVNAPSQNSLRAPISEAPAWIPQVQ